MRELGTAGLLVLVFLTASIIDPAFTQTTNLENIILWVPLLAVVGMGQMMVIITRGIDVSVGSMVGLSAMAVGMVFRENPGLPIPLGMFLGVGVGLMLGMVNALVISFGRVPPIIATLGTLSAYRGLIFIVSGSRQVDRNYVPKALVDWSFQGPIPMITWLLLLALAVCLTAAWFLKRTRMGRDVYALGSNPEAALLRGVPVRRTTFMVYAITGALCGLAGSLYLSRYGVANPATAGAGLELSVIAAVVIGGTNVTGGSGTVLGVVLGALLLGVINVALSVLQVAGTWQLLVYGVVILLAVIVDTLIRRGVARLETVA